MWTKIFNYTICAVALGVTIALTFSGGWFTLVGICLCGILYISGEMFPKVWRDFWITNIKITNKFFQL